MGGGGLAHLVGRKAFPFLVPGFADKVGLNTFYGQSFLADVCELGPEMLPYSRKYFEELISRSSARFSGCSLR